jgi:hypothetical protein
MRGMKIALIAVGVIVAYFLVSMVIGLVFEVLILAAVVGAVVLGIKLYRSGRQVSAAHTDRAIGDYYHPQQREPDADSRPTARQYVQQHVQDVDDEIARLKREMGR